MCFLHLALPVRCVITISIMQHYIHNTRRHHGEYNEHYHVLEHSTLGIEHTLVHQELEELRQFAPLTRTHSAEARRSGTRLSTAKAKLSTLVRYVYLSLF
jgi:hypothetical protein